MASEVATLAGGCFWCTEAVFKDVIGVEQVESGYIGGTVPYPHSADQREAQAAIARASADWPAPIVTTIEPLAEWYPAEGYHQQYWEGEGQSNPYCLAVIPPKLKKLRKSFAGRSKSEVAA
jgi:peptide methionine sulfoxide reductase MsrA